MPAVADSLDEGFFDGAEIGQALRPIKGIQDCYALPIGDIRRFIYTPLSAYRRRIEPLVSAINQLEHQIKIYDCRGGIDRFTIGVCRQVDVILVVTETDVASVQSTKNVVDSLRSAGLDDKIGGYCINRLFARPSGYSSIFTGPFRHTAFGGIPFDLESMRRFLSRETSAREFRSPRNMVQASAQALLGPNPRFVFRIAGPVFQEADIERLSLRDPREVGGQALGAALTAAVTAVGIGWYYLIEEEIGSVLFELSSAATGEASLAVSNLIYATSSLVERTWYVGMGFLIVTGVLGLVISFEGGRRLLGRLLSTLMLPIRLFQKRSLAGDDD